MEDKEIINQEKAESPVDDTMGLKMSGHILITDKESGEELVNKRNAIHYGNMANMIARAITDKLGNYYIWQMGFGNGATSVDTASTTQDGSYVFDELGLLSYADDINDSILLTHVIFHPVQKSKNREIEIVYTVRVQLN